ALPEPLRIGAHDIAAVWKTHPDDPSVLYQVAAIYARAGRHADAIAVLKRLEKTGAGLVPRPRDGFGALDKDPEAAPLLARRRPASPTVHRAKVAFSIGEGDLVPEGIAYSARRRTFYLGSIKRKIIAVSEKGEVRDFVGPAAGDLGAVVGLRVDDARGELW